MDNGVAGTTEALEVNVGEYIDTLRESAAVEVCAFCLGSRTNGGCELALSEPDPDPEPDRDPKAKSAAGLSSPAGIATDRPGTAESRSAIVALDRPG